MHVVMQGVLWRELQHPWFPYGQTIIRKDNNANCISKIPLRHDGTMMDVQAPWEGASACPGNHPSMLLPFAVAKIAPERRKDYDTDWRFLGWLSMNYELFILSHFSNHWRTKNFLFTNASTNCVGLLQGNEIHRKLCNQALCCKSSPASCDVIFRSAVFQTSGDVTDWFIMHTDYGPWSSHYRLFYGSHYRLISINSKLVMMRAIKKT